MGDEKLHSSKRKAWLVALAILVVALIGVSITIEVIARKSWPPFERGVAELLEEARREHVPRVPLRPPTERGDASSYYSSALKKFGPGHLQSNPGAFLANDPKVDRTLLDADLAAAAPALSDLSLGAKCPEVYRRPSSESPSYGMIRSPSSFYLSQLAVVQAKILVENGRRSEALDLLLDVVQFGRDYIELFGTESSSVLRLILEEAFEGLRDHLVARIWGGEDLKGLASALETLDRSFPSDEAEKKGWLGQYGAWLLVEDPYSSQTSLGAEISRDYYPADLRHGFSMRIFKAAAFERGLNALRRPADGRGKRPLLPEDESANDFERGWLDHILGEDPSLECRTSLRLLRGAVAFLLGTEVPELGDPYGTRLHVQHTPEGLKLWSVGRDGVDDGGRGRWKRRGTKEEAVGVPDIVLEMKR